MDRRPSATFEGRRRFRRMWILIAGFGVFVPIGVVFFLTTGEPASLLMAAFGLFPALVMIPMVLSPGIEYGIGPEGLLLRSRRSRRLVPGEQIRGAAVLSEGQAVEALNRYLAPAIASEPGLNLKAWYRSNSPYGNFVRYCSVPVVQERTHGGSPQNVVKFGNLTSGSFVLLKLTSKEEFLLSPVDCKGLLAAIASLSRLADPTPVSSFSPRAGTGPTRKERGRSCPAPWPRPDSTA
jgi:hypothetical protein